MQELLWRTFPGVELLSNGRCERPSLGGMLRTANVPTFLSLKFAVSEMTSLAVCAPGYSCITLLFLSACFIFVPSQPSSNVIPSQAHPGAVWLYYRPMDINMGSSGRLGLVSGLCWFLAVWPRASHLQLWTWIFTSERSENPSAPVPYVMVKKRKSLMYQGKWNWMEA